MAYTAHEWEDGEVITAEKLNALEQAVAAISADGAIKSANLADGAVTSVSIRETASGDVGPGPVSPEEQGGLPAWAIVLICAGGVLVVGGAAAAVFLIARKKRNG